MINENALALDSTSENLAEAQALQWWILHYINEKGEVTAGDIYRDSECGDIAMYLALHNLIKINFIYGISPYSNESADNHTQMVFKKINVLFANDYIEELAKEYNPEDWNN